MRIVLSLLTVLCVVPALSLAADEAAPPEPSEPAAAASTGSVTRAQFTNAIQDREPTDNVSALPSDQTRVYFFTELKDLAGKRITHRWEYKGKVMAEPSFDVGGARWRVWSSKTFDPLWTGEWKVSVVDESGAVLASEVLNYGEEPAAAPAQ